MLEGQKLAVRDGYYTTRHTERDKVYIYTMFNKYF